MAAGSRARPKPNQADRVNIANREVAAKKRKKSPEDENPTPPKRKARQDASQSNQRASTSLSIPERSRRSRPNSKASNSRGANTYEPPHSPGSCQDQGRSTTGSRAVEAAAEEKSADLLTRSPVRITRSRGARRKEEDSLSKPLETSAAPARKKGKAKKTLKSPRQTEEDHQTQLQQEPLANEDSARTLRQLKRGSGVRERKATASLLERIAAGEQFGAAKNVCGCKQAWDEIVKAVKDIQPFMEDVQTDEVNEFLELIERPRQAYERAVATGELGGINETAKLENDICKIAEWIGNIHPKGEASNNALLFDIYLHAVPEMAALIGACLVARCHENIISRPSRNELVELIDMTVQLREKAKSWDPYPKLPKTVKNNVSGTIPRGLTTLRNAYMQPSEDEVNAKLARIEEGRRLLAEFTERAALLRVRGKGDRVDKEKRQKEVNEHLARAEAAQKRRRQETARIVSAREEIDVFDMAGLEVGDSSPWLNGTSVQMPRNRDYATTGRNPASRQPPKLPRMSREGTEEIPGPMARKWDESEDEALLAGLEQFLGANRFVEIQDTYGVNGGPLCARDVDELVQRAIFYKQSMMSRIQAEAEERGYAHEWDWLLSVES